MSKRRKSHQLTAITVKKLREPGRHSDGRGLYLAVSKTGAKSWIFIGILHGKRHVVGLGSVDNVSLHEARDETSRIVKEMKKGVPPIGANQFPPRAGNTATSASAENTDARLIIKPCKEGSMTTTNLASSFMQNGLLELPTNIKRLIEEAAIRRASSLVSNLAADRRPGL
jgi:hypothetical protein